MPRPCWLLLLLIAPAVASAEGPPTEVTVGMSVRFDAVVIPGAEIHSTDERGAAAVVRIVRVYPHGSDFRYDLDFYALTPGTHDVRTYLRRPNGQPLGDEVSPILVKVVPLLPPGQVQPNALEIQSGPSIGGYKTWVNIAIVAWAVGLLSIVGWMAAGLFRKRQLAASEKPLTLADRLRPLVEGAIAGNLSQAELANLERSLMAYWRKKLDLEGVDPATAIAQLRAHPDAGPLLIQLEEWLHKPGPPAVVVVGELLRPYQNLPPDEADLEVKG